MIKLAGGQQGGAFLEPRNWRNLGERHRTGGQTNKHTLTHKHANAPQREMWASSVRRGHKVNHAGLISLLCLHLCCWLSDTQRWRSAHSFWRLQPLNEPWTAYNYIWAHGKIAVWCEKCHIEIRRRSWWRVWGDEIRGEFTVKKKGFWPWVFLSLFALCFIPWHFSFVVSLQPAIAPQVSSLFPVCRLHVLVILQQ